jgi:hypothetical protein
LTIIDGDSGGKLPLKGRLWGLFPSMALFDIGGGMGGLEPGPFVSLPCWPFDVPSPLTIIVEEGGGMLPLERRLCWLLLPGIPPLNIEGCIGGLEPGPLIGHPFGKVGVTFPLSIIVGEGSDMVPLDMRL